MSLFPDTIDAKLWVREWLRVIEKNPSIPTDEGTMLGWFANAIMAGYDSGWNARGLIIPSSVIGKDCYREKCE